MPKYFESKTEDKVSVEKSVHAWCFTEVCLHSALLNIFLMTWMMEQRIPLLNLHADDMLGGNFDRLDDRIRNQNVSLL